MIDSTRTAGLILYADRLWTMAELRALWAAECVDPEEPEEEDPLGPDEGDPVGAWDWSDLA